MRSKSLFPGALFFSVAFVAFGFVACNGNVIIDNGSCPSGTKSCGGLCVELATDEDNCGSCGNLCADGVTCISGACGGITNTGGTGGGSGGSNPTGGVAGGGGTTSVCPPGYSLCGDLCADLQNDPYNCGSCNNYCSSGVCDAGSCVLPPDCVGCGEFISGGGGELCPGLSEKLYDTLVNCICADQCVALCSDNVCSGTNITDACQNCVLDTVNGCGNSFNECSNDI